MGPNYTYMTVFTKARLWTKSSGDAVHYIVIAANNKFQVIRKIFTYFYCNGQCEMFLDMRIVSV
jgi:hypothetical protein